jgi:hypothetical protein
VLCVRIGIGTRLPITPAAKRAPPSSSQAQQRQHLSGPGDVTLGEDRSRIPTCPSVFVRLRGFAFNINKAKSVRNHEPRSLPVALADIETVR